jgi:DNA replication protein DnaC
MNVKLETVTERMESLGMSFMSAGLESFLDETHRQEQTILDIIADLVELEYIPRKERSAYSRLKLSGIPAVKRLEDFDKVGPRAEPQIDSSMSYPPSMAFIERKENVVLKGHSPSGLGKSHLMLARP